VTLKTTIVSGQWLGKHVPAATNTQATIELVLQNGVSTWSALRHYKQGTKSVVRELCIRGCENNTCAPEAEESPLLEAVARERLVKI
jgi:hypothetical protein